MKRKLIKIPLLITGLLIIGLPVTDLAIASLKTRQMVQGLLRSDECRLDPDLIDKHRIDVLLMVEDPAFYQHKGLDFKSPGAGWTTISQGLVKLFYFRQFQPGILKIRLILITRIVFDPAVPKGEQLKLFYNYAYFGQDDEGNEISGFLHASEFYFKKEFPELTQDEYLSLVAMLINPNRYRIDKFPDRNRERVGRIKKLIHGDCEPNDWKDCELNGCGSLIR